MKSWFNPRPYVKPSPVAPKPVTKEVANSHYTVGVTSDNRTIVKLTSGYVTLELSLNDAAVRQMIRLLEATLREENDQPTHQPDEPVV